MPIRDHAGFSFSFLLFLLLTFYHPFPPPHKQPSVGAAGSFYKIDSKVAEAMKAATLYKEASRAVCTQPLCSPGHSFKKKALLVHSPLRELRSFEIVNALLAYSQLRQPRP